MVRRRLLSWVDMHGREALSHKSFDAGVTHTSLIAWLAVMLALLIRATSPSDLHDQTQPRTVAYTVDIVLHPTLDRWILPMERGMEYATKPPLYNWLAAPLVEMTEGRSELAHRAPSVLSYLLLAGLVWTIGRRLEPEGLLAPLSLLIFATHYMWFKLSWLARPDTLLTLWLILGWISATSLSAADREGVASRRGVITLHQVNLWLCGAMAMLTKGPVGLVLPVFVVVLGVVDAKRAGVGWRLSIGRAGLNLLRAGGWWGIPMMAGVFGMWAWGAYHIDPDHFLNTLILDEIADRMLGVNRDMAEGGPLDLVLTLPYMPLYFVTRFLPWSIVPVLAAAWWCRTKTRTRLCHAAGDISPLLGAWLWSSATWIIVLLIVFSSTAAKRADYIASVFIPGALLTAVLIERIGPRVLRSWLVAVQVGGMGTLAALAIHAHTLDYSARYPLADSLRDFSQKVRERIAQEPLPIELYRVGAAPLQSYLFLSQPDDDIAITRRIERGEAFWLVSRQPYLAELKGRWGGLGWRFAEILRSEAAMGSESSGSYEAVLCRVDRRQ